jgi:hypothetical protein
MAIKQYDITDSTTSIESLKTIFETVATAYFDSLVLSEDKNTLDCYCGTHLLLSFNFKNNKVLTVTVYGNGVSKSDTQQRTDYLAYVYKVITTENGIALAVYSNGAKYHSSIFISKTNSGETGVIVLDKLLTNPSAQTNKTLCAVTKNSIDVSAVYDFVNGTKEQPTTTIFPIAVSGHADYFNNVFCVPTSPYVGADSILTLDGVDYYYNGYMALKDE